MKKRLISLAVLGAGLGTFFPAPAGPLLDSLEKEITEVVAAAIPAVVSVRTEPLSGRWEEFFPEGEAPDWFEGFLKSGFASRRKRGSGSGFIFDPEGYVLTTEHVVRNASQVEVVLTDGRVLPGEIVGKDDRFNLALLRIKGDKFPFLKLGRSDEMKVGSWVISVGNPFGLFTSPSWGIVSGLGRSGLGTALYEDLIQITAPVNPGDSGGPLLNSRGEVIGIITATLSGYREFEFDWPFIRRFQGCFPGDLPGNFNDFFQPSQAQGIGFAIPVDLAREVVERLRRPVGSAPGWLGVRIEEISPAANRGEEAEKGVVVLEVIPNAPAARAGLEKGDIIIALGGIEVNLPRDLQKAVLFSPLGSKIKMEVIREGKRRQISVILEEQPGKGGKEE